MNTSISCPITATENTCSVYWYNPQRMMQLNQLLLSDCFPQREDLPIEHDGIDSQENPILLAYDFDMQRINRFNTGLNVYGYPGT